MNRQTILVIGSGGREHALAWKLAQSPRVSQIYVAPGNAGTEWEPGPGRAPAHNVPVAAEDFGRLIAFAQGQGPVASGFNVSRVDLTVVGPEGPLADGIVDAFQAQGLAIFGPSRPAAELEGSKAFAKAFMQAQGIPTAAFRSFNRYEEARKYVSELDGPVVVKASGLAAGKGVIVCQYPAEAQLALQKIMQERSFGPAGDTVVIEEYLSGPELSVLAFSDGQNIALMPPARDHKRVFDGNRGPNTGGMGAYAPASDVDETLIDAVRQHVLQPAVDGMAAQGTPYIGVLYAGLMLTAAGPKVLEFNCRFGDPETQVILPLLSSDLVEILLACVNGRLNQVAVEWQPGTCATVVMASDGYPGSYAMGRPISGVAEADALDDVVVFQAGTASQDGQLVTAGGRVLAVSATGPSLAASLERAYGGISQIHFEGAHYRRDIGRPAD